LSEKLGNSKSGDPIMANRVKVIGISGSTNSGKTTLAKYLAKHVENSKIIFQDDYYFHESTGRIEYLAHINYYNYESISAINMSKLSIDLDYDIEYGQYDYIFIDGFLLYADSDLTRKFDKKYFLQVDKEICRERRKQRVYDGQVDAIGYFESYIWPSFLEYKELCESMKGTEIVYMNSNESIEKIVDFVLNDLKKI
jgi:uridine kinase